MSVRFWVTHTHTNPSLPAWPSVYLDAIRQKLEVVWGRVFPSKHCAVGLGLQALAVAVLAVFDALIHSGWWGRERCSWCVGLHKEHCTYNRSNGVLMEIPAKRRQKHPLPPVTISSTERLCL